VQIGIFLPTASPFADADWLHAVASETEARGIDAVWIPEHVVSFGDYASHYPYSPDGKMPAGPQSGMLEPFTTLAFLAASTTSIRLGTAICLLAQRNPVYAAKEIANLDWLSKGRVDLGIGVGWLREEYEAVGIPWPRRGSRTEECVEVLKALWCDDVSSYKGEFYDLPSCSMYPKPIQDPHPPVHFGGESDAAISRAARIGQGWHSFGRLPGDVPVVLEKLDRELERFGRSRTDFQVTVSPYLHPVNPEMVDQYIDSGIDQLTLMLLAFSAPDIPGALDALEPCFERARRS
jgi:probable F420-dependent oxidoreductase